MRNLVLVCFFSFSSPLAFSQNSSDAVELVEAHETNTSHPLEYSRQAFMNVELPLYGLYFLSRVPSYLNVGAAHFHLNMPSSLSFLEWSSLVHLGLFLGSSVQTGEIPGFRESNKTDLDRVLIAERELLMPVYGALVLAQKSCEYSGICAPQGGRLAFVFDQYFPLDNVLIPVLRMVRQSLNNGSDAVYENSQVQMLPTMSDMSHLMPIGNVVGFASGFAQIAAALKGPQDPGYQKISFYRALYLVTYFSWLGINHVPMLVDETVRLSKFVLLSIENAKKTEL